MQIPQIEPFQFIRSTAFSERVQLANKINEIIDGINQIGDIPDLKNRITELTAKVTELEESIGNTDTSLAELENQVNTIVSEVNGLLKEVVNEVALDAPEYGQVRVKVIHEDDTETTSNALQIPVIVDGGISLISGTTARSFKIRYITADGVTHTTNDFVIPEGGSGTDVTVTSVTILEGDTDNSFKFEVGLSDGSSIQSNSYPFPAASELTPATTSQLGGIKVGTHLSVTADGTLSVDMTTIGKAADASTVMWTSDASKVTFHADSLSGTEFSKDIPQASQGGAGTIDQESYAKIAATESKVNALAPSVSVNERVSPPQITVSVNGKSSTANLPNGGTDSLIRFTTEITGEPEFPKFSLLDISTANASEYFSVEHGVPGGNSATITCLKDFAIAHGGDISHSGIIIKKGFKTIVSKPAYAMDDFLIFYFPLSASVPSLALTDSNMDLSYASISISFEDHTKFNIDRTMVGNMTQNIPDFFNPSGSISLKFNRSKCTPVSSKAEITGINFNWTQCAFLG